MSKHIFGMVLTHKGIAANNRGETDGNNSYLQKITTEGEVYTTVSAEAIRWSIRKHLQDNGKDVNRRWIEDKRDHDWQDHEFSEYTKGTKTYVDDDLLGFMLAKKKKVKGEEDKDDTRKRKGALDISRAISTTPFEGDVTYNSRSEATKGGTSLYTIEMHHTQYQYGFSLTPDHLKVSENAQFALDAIAGLGQVAGNHSRFLFDFSPESIIIRVTQDMAPRILYCYQAKNGKIVIPDITQKVRNGDISGGELYFGGKITEDPETQGIKDAHLFPGVKAAAEAVKKSLEG